MQKLAIGVEDLAGCYHFLANDLREYLNHLYRTMSRDDRYSIYGSTIRNAINYLDSSVDGIKNVANGIIRDDIKKVIGGIDVR